MPDSGNTAEFEQEEDSVGREFMLEAGMARYLTIIEVSQKQAYIFAENKLKSNINRSREIAYITSIEYIQSTLEDTDSLQVSEHLVYTGGGHTIMEFGSEQDAREVVRALTRKSLDRFSSDRTVRKTTEYDEKRTPGENIKNLTAELEKKKSLRISSFHQGTFGIEQIETNTGRAKTSGEGVKIKFKPEPAPEGFLAASRFEDLGGTKGENNYIAVVHIDGNSMGKRVEALTEKYTVGQWEQYKKEMRAFSEALASDFLSAYGDMEKVVAENIRNSRLQSLGLKEDERSKCMYLPVRRVISEEMISVLFRKAGSGSNVQSCFSGNWQKKKMMWITTNTPPARELR